MEPIHCRQHLDILLTDESTALERLEVLLAKEYELLAGNDIDGLEAAGAARQQCVASLVRIEDERRSLCRAIGLAGDVAGLERLLKWCDPEGSLKARWSECATRAQRCREQNDRNGMLVGARLKRVETMLGALGVRQESRTYGPQGSAAPRAFRNSLSALA